jgi:hypothetical protein
MGPVSYEPVVSHDKYQKITLTWGETSRGLETRVYVRALNDGGQFRICAYYVDDITGTQKELIRAWFDAAYFTHNGKKIVSSKFIRGQPKSVGATSGCITTKTLKKDVNIFAVSMEGRRVTVSF